MMLLREKVNVQRDKRRRPRTEHCGKPNSRGWGDGGGGEKTEKPREIEETEKDKLEVGREIKLLYCCVLETKIIVSNSFKITISGNHDYMVIMYISQVT